MEIEVSGLKVFIDDEDYELFNTYSWYVSKHIRDKYVKHCTKNETIRLHRFILGIKKGDKRQVDHINGNTLDNRKENLRICTNSQNQMNRGKNKKNNLYKGVTKAHGKYQAVIIENKKRHYLGLFETPEMAHNAYCEASKKYHGEFGRIK